MTKEEQLLQDILSEMKNMNIEVAHSRPILEQVCEYMKKTDTHDKRITAVENSRLPLAAGSAVVGGILSHFLRLIF